MRFLIVRTDVRAIAPEQATRTWAGGGRVRDEWTAPEQRRQIVSADDLDAAVHLARALASVGAVRAGRQRVKIVRVGEPAAEAGARARHARR